MAYSKEAERQNKVLGDLLTGKEPEKRIFVGYQGEKSTEKQKDVESHLTKIMKEVRMPWFCPKCKRVMKKRLDNKMWRLFQHCFECQIEEEHEMRVNGTFEAYEKKKVIQNKISALSNNIDELKEWLKEEKTEYVEPVNVDTGFVHVEKFEKTEEMLQEGKDAVKMLENKKKEFEKLLEDVKNGNK